MDEKEYEKLRAKLTPEEEKAQREKIWAEIKLMRDMSPEEYREKYSSGRRLPLR